jgi:hypothetical protein
MTTADTERDFPVFARGELRDMFLLHVRNGLRAMTNPSTGQPWTEEEVRLATAPGSLTYTRADAGDLVGLAKQQRGVWLADQVIAKRASREWLIRYHAAPYNEAPLPATGGGGTVKTSTTTAATFIGSTTLPDANAALVKDDRGNRYQVLFDVDVAVPTAEVFLTVKSIDGGTETNLEPGRRLTWVRQPAGASPVVEVHARFSGGGPAESTMDFARRLDTKKAYTRGSGNPAQWREWARRVDGAVEDVFVYACAYNAGSLHLCILQRRAIGSTSPTARIASAPLLAVVRARITPPGSPDVPGNPLVVTTGATSSPVHMQAHITMPAGKGRGWTRSGPWPLAAAAATSITSVASQTSFDIALGGGVQQDPTADEVPALMVWDLATSSFVVLEVASVTYVSGATYAVALTTAPAGHTLAIGDFISPAAGCFREIAEGARAYFDSLGPGEIVVDTDSRSSRAARFPAPQDEWPMRVDATLTGFLKTAMGSLLVGGTTPTTTTPSPPTSPSPGPRLLTLGNFAVYPQV